MVYAVTFCENDMALLPRMESASSAWRLGRSKLLRPGGARMQSLAAGLLLDYALSAEGYSPVRHVNLGTHGKPATDGVHFSLTHCHGLAACVLATHAVGIDAEPFRDFSQRLCRRAFTQEELASANASPNPRRHLTRLWTLKESLLKARGGGISEGLLNFAFVIEGDNITGPPGYSYQLFTVAESYSIAVSIEQQAASKATF